MKMRLATVAAIVSPGHNIEGIFYICNMMRR
jgi:hypothetical protein